MMCAKSVYDSPPKRPILRVRFSRKEKHLDMEDAKVALDIIIRPSVQLWKLGLGRNTLSALKRPQKTVILDDNTSSRSSIPPKKRVRFDEQPITISRKSFFGRFRKDSSSSPARPCLVLRFHDDVLHEASAPPPEADDHSVYEDCLSDDPSFLPDLHVLDGGGRSDTRSPTCVRRSEFYETESGIATFDRSGYASYCLSMWLDKKRKESWAPKKQQLVFIDPVLSPRSKPTTLSQPSNDTLDMVCSVSPLSAHIRKPRSLPRRIWKYVEDELQNAVVVLIIGSFIHLCLFLFLLYDILARGLIPSDD